MTNQTTMTRLAAAGLSLLICACAAIAEGQAPDDPALAPKLAETATPITRDMAYLRAAPAPDYWAFAPFVKPQFTNSACSIASVTGIVNGLRGLPVLAKDSVTTQPGMLEITGDPVWADVSAEGGDGVAFDQLVMFTQKALTANGLTDYETEVFHPEAANAAALDQMRAILTANEMSAEDALLVYFNQGVVTGDWDGPHVSVVGAYDAGTDRVLVLEVDQEWYIPYWTPTETLLAAMVKPTSAEHGVLEGETGGFVHIVR